MQMLVIINSESVWDILHTGQDILEIRLAGRCKMHANGGHEVAEKRLMTGF